MPTLLDFLPRWGEALCCRSIARMAPHVLCSLSYSRHPCCSLDLVSVTEHVAQTAQPQGLLSSKLNQVRPFHGTSVGKQPSPSQALSACTHPPSHTHTHTHMRRVACWLLSAGDGSRGDTALPRPQPVDEPRPALPALRGPLPSKPHSQPGQPSKSPWQQLPEFFWSLRHPSLLEWKPSVTVC